MGNIDLVCMQYLSQMLDVLQVFAPSTQISFTLKNYTCCFQYCGLQIVEFIINKKNRHI